MENRSGNALVPDCWKENYAPFPDGWKVKYDLWHPHQLVEDDHVPKGWKTGPVDALVPDSWKEKLVICC